MRKTTGSMILLALAVAGAGCGTNDTEPTAPSKAAEPLAPSKAVEPLVASDSPTVHASLSLGDEHVLQFVEFKPGLLGVVEKGRNVLDVPKATTELTRLPWLDLYRHFAGTSAPVPEGMTAAQVRASTRAFAPTLTAPRLPVTESVGDGPHFYNSFEQTWFRNTFCNGAQDCVQGYDWTTMQSTRAINHGSAVAMVGSEGTTNATFKQYWWDCTWNIFYGTDCWWLEFGSLIVVPGHWAGLNLTGGTNYIRWYLTGGGANTQVSSSTNY